MVAHHITINYIVERRNKQNESNIVMAIFFFFLYNYKCSFVLTLMKRRFVCVDKYNGYWIKEQRKVMKKKLEKIQEGSK